jgi:vancomycin resistance protein YoaR
MRGSRLSWLLAGALAATGLFGIWSSTDRIAVGVHVAGTDVSGRTMTEARSLLTPAAEAFASAIVVVIDGERVWAATNSELGITLDTDRAADLAFGVGREPDPQTRLRSLALGITQGIDLGWPRTAEGPRLEEFIERLARDVEIRPVDGAVAIATTGVRVTAPVDGRRVERGLLRAALLEREQSDVVGLPASGIEPALGASAIADASDAATAAYRPLQATAGSEVTTVPAERIASVLEIDRDTTGDGERLRVAVNATALQTLVGEVAASLDGDRRDAVLVPGGEHLEVVAGRDGVVVDRSAASAVLAAAILSGSSDRLVNIPAAIVPAGFSTSQAREIADRLRLAGGYTTYFPENWARETNIGRAAATFDGMVVEPGATFSFWDRIGEVSPRTGYVSAGAIIGGVSQTAIGGGLCQVSTTLFNAVVLGGYRIDERYPHSYYIERYPLGLDAAVFAPTVDLKWTNDTGAPVYIRASANATSVSFWIYSPPTGRSASFSEPVEANRRWPAAGQPADAAHAPGYVVLGRDVWVTRTVMQDGAVIHRDTFFSHYAPVWGGPAR